MILYKVMTVKIGLTFVLEDAEEVRLFDVIVFCCSPDISPISAHIMSDLTHVVVSAGEGMAARVLLAGRLGERCEILVR